MQLSELHLDSPLTRMRMQAENIKNKGRTVDNLSGLPDLALKMTLLSGSEIIIEDNNLRVERAGELPYLLNLTGSDKGLRDRVIKTLDHTADRNSARRVYKTFEFV